MRPFTAFGRRNWPGRLDIINQVALISQTSKVKMNDLALVSAAIQKQVTRDLGPAWNIDASVDNFEELEDVPLGYWQVIIKDDIPYDAQGIHLNQASGQPFALVKYSEDWPLTTSHEAIEMLVDPSGNRTVAVNSSKPDQGRVLLLIEVCDPSEATRYGYSVNGILLSDFYTPRFLDPVVSDGVQYSFSGAIKKPLDVLDGGYISWWDPVTTHVFQMFVSGTRKQFVDRGPLPTGFGTLRSFADSFTNKHRAEIKKTHPRGLLLTSAISGKKESKIDRSRKAHATVLEREIKALFKR
jgi:hypothetical protein